MERYSVEGDDLKKITEKSPTKKLVKYRESFLENLINSS